MAAGVTPPEIDFWREGMDRTLFSRVYTRSTQVGVVAALLALGLDQRGVSLGILSGLAVGLFSLWTVEATVKLLFNGGKHAGPKLAIAALIKFPFMLASLLPVAWAVYNKHINVFGVVGGVVLVHATILIMIVGTALANADRNPERYR